MAYKVMIVDDQNMARGLFESIVKSSNDYELVLSLDSASDADVYMAKYDLDLVIMDIVMKEGINGLEAAEKLKKNYPDTKVLMVTSMPEHAFIKRAREIGVDSFWYKEVAQKPFLEVMDRTMAGEHVYPDVSPVVSLGHAVSTDFTDRELDVLRVLAAGCSDEEISEILKISVATVRTHITHMRDKTGYRSRMELALNALRSGIVVPD